MLCARGELAYVRIFGALRVVPNDMAALVARRPDYASKLKRPPAGASGELGAPRVSQSLGGADYT